MIIDSSSFIKFIVNLYYDYTTIILFYWLRDDSEGFTNTTQLIDMSLDIIIEVLRTGIVAKAVDLVAFLFKSHIYSNVDNIYRIFTSLKDASLDLGKIMKDKSGGGKDEG